MEKTRLATSSLYNMSTQLLPILVSTKDFGSDLVLFVPLPCHIDYHFVSPRNIFLKYNRLRFNGSVFCNLLLSIIFLNFSYVDVSYQIR